MRPLCLPSAYLHHHAGALHGGSSTCWTPYYFHADGLLSPERENDGDDLLLHQADAMPTGSVNPGNHMVRNGPGRLAFDSAPLEQDVEVSGVIEAALWVSPASLDSDFRFELADVYPPDFDTPQGHVLLLCDDVLYRRYPERQAPVPPMAAAYRVRAETLPVSNVFRQGHRIRISITGRNHASSSLHRLYLGRVHDSHVVLPLILHRKR